MRRGEVRWYRFSKPDKRRPRVAKDRLGPLITTLSRARMAHIRAALLFALGF